MKRRKPRNPALEPTPNSFRSCVASAVERGSPPALGGPESEWKGLMPGSTNYYDLSAAQIAEGVSLCKENARRLLSDASALLEHGGRTGLAYALWSLAVEESGKAVSLEALAAGKAPSDGVRVPQSIFRGQHKEKFEAGFTRIQQKVGTTFAEVVRVMQNAAETATTVRHPSAQSSVVSIPGHTTGEFEDITAGAAGRQASHLLRLELLYVDWDDTQHAWREPDLNSPQVAGHFTISGQDLRRGIRALGDDLCRTTQ